MQKTQCSHMRRCCTSSAIEAVEHMGAALAAVPSPSKVGEVLAKCEALVRSFLLETPHSNFTTVCL